MAITVTTPEPTVILDAPAHKLRQGGRTVYYFGLTIAQFDDALPEEVDAKVIREQRRFVPGHARAIEDYLGKIDQWVLGPVTLCIDPHFVEFDPYPGQEPDASPVIGRLRITQGGKPYLRILDGQHRRWAIRRYRTSDPLDEAFKKRQENFEVCEMPVALYEESDTQAIRQMFADMARQRNMNAVTTARFDMRDPYNRAAYQLRESSDWICPFVEMDSSTVSRTSNKLIAFNQLAANLKTLQYGYSGRVSRTRSEEAAEDIEGIVERGKQWIDEFLPAAREEYLDLQSPDVEPDYVKSRRPHTLAYSGTMLRILAGCHYEWRKRHSSLDMDILAEYIKGLSFDPKQQTGIFVETDVLNVERRLLVAGKYQIESAINSIVNEAYRAYRSDDN